jgi:hypothetical protein
VALNDFAEILDLVFALDVSIAPVGESKLDFIPAVDGTLDLLQIYILGTAALEEFHGYYITQFFRPDKRYWRESS